MMQLVKLWRVVRSPNLVPRESETPAPRGGPVAAPWNNRSSRPMSVCRWALLLTVAPVIALAGCRAATPAPDPEPPEPPDPAALLTGTWVQTSQYDDDGQTFRAVEVLTFTAAGRAVLYNGRYVNGEISEQFTESAGWSATDSTVTHTTYDDDDDETPAVRRDLVKHYRWDGETLLMNQWGDSGADPAVFHTYTRVADPLVGLIGPAWEWRRNEGARTASSTLTLNADGTFAHTRTVVGDSTVWTLAGSYRWDPEALAAVAGDDLTLTEQPAGGEPQTNPWTPNVDPYQYSFAPTDDPDVVVVSPAHAADAPHGRYIDYYDRQ